LKNKGDEASNVLLTDTLPLSTTFAHFIAQPTGGVTQVAAAPEQLTWNGTVSANQAITLTFVTSHTGVYSEIFTNTAQFFHESNGQSGLAAAQVMIEVPHLIISDAVASESAGTMHFEVALSGVSAEPVTVQYTTSDDTAQVGSDYLTKSGTLTIPAGMVSITLTIDLLDDDLAESNEQFVVTLSEASNALIEDSTGLGTIQDNDAPGLTVAPPSLTLSEGSTATYTIQLSKGPTSDVVLDLITDNQLTVAPTSLTFTPATWDLPQTVLVTALDDQLAEGSHTGLITHTVSSGDALYKNLVPLTLTAYLTDTVLPEKQFLIYLPLVVK
jgi:hypothetical protein